MKRGSSRRNVLSEARDVSMIWDGYGLLTDIGFRVSDELKVSSAYSLVRFQAMTYTKKLAKT